jgi:hypothetical protein
MDDDEKENVPPVDFFLDSKATFETNAAIPDIAFQPFNLNDDFIDDIVGKGGFFDGVNNLSYPVTGLNPTTAIGNLMPYEMIIIKHCISKLDRAYAQDLLHRTKASEAGRLDEVITQLLVADQLLSLRPEIDQRLVTHILEEGGSLLNYVAIACAEEIEHQLREISRTKGDSNCLELKDICINARIARLIKGNLRSLADKEHNPSHLKILLIASHIAREYNTFEDPWSSNVADVFKNRIDEIKKGYKLLYSTPNSGLTYFYLLESFDRLTRRDYSGASAMIEKAIERDPGNMDSALMKARVLAKSGNLAGAYGQISQIAENSSSKHGQSEALESRLKFAYAVGESSLIEKAKKEFVDSLGYDRLKRFLRENINSVTLEQLKKEGRTFSEGVDYAIVKLNKTLGADVTALLPQIKSGKVDYGSLIAHMLEQKPAGEYSTVEEFLKGRTPQQLAGVEIIINGSAAQLHIHDCVKPEHFLKKVYDPLNMAVNYMVMDIDMKINGGN